MIPACVLDGRHYHATTCIQTLQDFSASLNMQEYVFCTFIGGFLDFHLWHSDCGILMEDIHLAWAQCEWYPYNTRNLACLHNPFA